ncbi:metal ion ABC transporter, periplasmic metal-binding protein [Campylobacter hyointestinalis subsp. hyointestinalis LMG 9260]|uniref:metal ABC transporter solute-binding protein, Zn/Mn family n=1 Tax=Campylobacter hyointestinalis TaxID=198 RepID=UPI0007C8AEC8|nr:zinc ABC transporter substrate-binding protein [Campylobacter hyointestinalis]ANE33313.1 metal ion ABC transporter, periplasmic metal-binding protein [Campylobacter hyointestinalis subsp. hyointestinalis LMG 9260]TWO29562.1 cation ABC transporter substrate-binding protein [Campylobacter hyointestinalis]SUW89509.1 periplasmic solute binding protein [Campylobacter hyointestinalis]
MKKIITILCLSFMPFYAKGIVTASILPVKYFVEQIVGDTLEVGVMAPSGADPHTYEPRPNQMKMVEKSDLFFAVGMDYERVWIPKFTKSFANLKIIDTAYGIKLKKMEHSHDHEASEHKSDHEDSEGGFDPHIWLDPILVKTMAQNIFSALKAQYPQNAEIYSTNLAKFLQILDELDATIRSEFSNLKNKKFIVYHPSWGYFAKRYGLEQIAIEIEGKEPKPADLANLINEAKEEGVKVIFVAPQFSKKSANLIANEVHAKVVEIDQLPKDWLLSMKKTTEAFRQSF